MATKLTPCQNICIIVSYSTWILTAMILTSFAPDMLIYDEGNVYSCPSDYLKDGLADQVEIDEGKAYQIDPISH